MPFVNAVREIHAKRLRLSEISILSRDVSDSLLHGQEAEIGDHLKLRLEVRMALIRDYLMGKLHRAHQTVGPKPAIQQVLLAASEQTKKKIERAGAETQPKPVSKSGKPIKSEATE